MQDGMTAQATATDANAGGGQEQMMQQLVQALVSLGDPQLIAKIAQAAIQMLQNQGGSGGPQPPQGQMA
jgi:succinate dehydrogenase/fumarate reductase flavoprotein subunit